MSLESGLQSQVAVATVYCRRVDLGTLALAGISDLCTPTRI